MAEIIVYLKAGNGSPKEVRVDKATQVSQAAWFNLYHSGNQIQALQCQDAQGNVLAAFEADEVVGYLIQ